MKLAASEAGSGLEVRNSTSEPDKSSIRFRAEYKQNHIYKEWSAAQRVLERMQSSNKDTRIIMRGSVYLTANIKEMQNDN